MKVMIVHPGTQHSTQLAAAIKKSGNEVKLVTTVYDKKKSIINLFSKLLSSKEKQRLNSRKNHQLNDEDIELIGEIMGLMLLFIGRIDKKKKIYVLFKRMVAKYVGIKAAQKAIKENYDIIIAFDSYAKYPFEKLLKEHSKILKVIDYSAAYAPVAKNVYKKIISQYPNLESTLKADRCVLWNKSYYEDMLKEAKLTDLIICASTYTKQTLLSNKIDNEKIYVIPYGYDSKHNVKDVEKKEDVFFTILFVGGVNVMKGIPYVIQALKKIKNDKIRLVLVGNVQNTIRNMAKNDNRIIFKGYIPHENVHLEYQKADLFIFPSLSDGFGFAPLEAMSYGVPCMVTNTSGISDIIDNGENGFIIKASSSEEIREKIEWCYRERVKLKEMGNLAKLRALNFGKKEYDEKIEKFLKNLDKLKQE